MWSPEHKQQQERQIRWEYDQAIRRGNYILAARIALANPDLGLWVWTWDPLTGRDIQKEIMAP